MHIDENTVAICMATYNGEHYLSEQIQSILEQSFDNWILFIRDDGSTDNTKKIINNYVDNYPNQIVLIDNPSLKGGSSKSNFSIILNWVKSNYSFRYFMFCDQDDVWLPHKIEKSLNVMQEAENNKMQPILVHSDLKVVDSSLKILGDSFFKYRALNSNLKDLNHMLIQNNVTGCTMMWNASLNDIVSLENPDIAMHDWWIALVASCFGLIISINEQTILYRQHNKNVVGATKVNSLSFICSRLAGRNRVKETLNSSIQQAGAFYKEYYYTLDSSQKEIIKKFSSLNSYNKARRVFEIIRGRFFKQGVIQIIGEFMYI